VPLTVAPDLVGVPFNENDGMTRAGARRLHVERAQSIAGSAE
jgi:hypothetical protein